MSPRLGLSTRPQLTLRHKLLKARQEWCNRHFIPIDQVEKHVTLSNVRDELKKFPDLSEREIADTAAVICTRSKKLFTAFCCGAPEDHLQYIQAVLGESITDDNIPFSRVELSRAAPEDTTNIGLARRGHDKCEKPDHTSCVIGVFLKWNEIDITDLLRDQWLALAPVFQSTPGQIPHFDLDPGVVLPFLYVPQREIKVGGFGEVSQIQIHPAHQKLLRRQDPRNSENPLLADKELFSKDIKMFQDERVMHEAVTSKNHKHLIKLLATYKLADKFHLLFLYADSNLRAYWNNVNPTPRWEKEHCIWSLRQMRGLASGIHVIHEFNNKQSLPPTTRSKESTFHRPNYGANIMKVDPSEALYGRHGDLKPENILWINAEDEFGKGGYLQVADFGLGRFHRQDSRSRVDPKTVLGSATYIPPELVLEEYISRAYDIWSLGCIFLEFITWMLDGKPGLERFVEARVAMAHDNVEDDTFFTASMETPKHAEVRPGVKSWIDSLRQHRNCSSMIHDLLNLVQAKMLRVQSTERIRSEPLVVELDAILKKGERDHIYLLEISSNR